MNQQVPQDKQFAKSVLLAQAAGEIAQTLFVLTVATAGNDEDGELGKVLDAAYEYEHAIIGPKMSATFTEQVRVELAQIGLSESNLEEVFDIVLATAEKGSRIFIEQQAQEEIIEAATAAEGLLTTHRDTILQVGVLHETLLGKLKRKWQSLLEQFPTPESLALAGLRQGGEELFVIYEGGCKSLSFLLREMVLMDITRCFTMRLVGAETARKLAELYCSSDGSQIVH